MWNTISSGENLIDIYTKGLENIEHTQFESNFDFDFQIFDSECKKKGTI